MNSLNFYDGHFRKIYVLEGLENHPVTRRIIDRLAGVPWRIIPDKDFIPREERNQNTLMLNSPRTSILNYCPGSKGHLCCNYLTIDLYAGCTLGCTYCIMKSYLNFSPIIVNVDLKRTINEVIALAGENLSIRVGTGEVGDSLLYDPLFELSRELVMAFAPYPNIHFEMKSKTPFVDHLLDIPRKGSAVLGFSLNPQSIIDSEEGTASSLEERLEAARKGVNAGYKVAFHFDPLFHFPGWQEEYTTLVRRLGIFKKEDIAWISLGTFRYPPALKDRIEQRWYLYDEFVLCKDKKFRYLQKFRGEMYRHLNRVLNEIFQEPPVYMCMESPAMWKKVFQQKPGKIPHLCTIFKKVNLEKDLENKE